MKSLKESELHGDQFPETCVQEIVAYTVQVALGKGDGGGELTYANL